MKYSRPSRVFIVSLTIMGFSHRPATRHQAHRPSQNRLSGGLYHGDGVFIEVAPCVCSGCHTHPGVDSGYAQSQAISCSKIVGANLDSAPSRRATYSETSPLFPDGCTYVRSVSGNKLIDTFVIESGQAAGITSAPIWPSTKQSFPVRR